MFLHQQRLLLFVAAALAVAMHMGALVTTQAAALPAVPVAYGRNAAWVKRRQASTAEERSWVGGRLQRRPLDERGLPRRRRRATKPGQRVFQADASDAPSSSSVSASNVAQPTSDSCDSAFPVVTPVPTTTTETVTSTVTSTSTVTPPTVIPADPTTTTSTSTTTSPTSTQTSAATTTSTSTATSSSTTTAASQSTFAPYPIATVTTGAGTPLILQSNTAGYGWTEASTDLNNIMQWAGDDGNLTDDEKTEVLAALFSGSARFWPEIPTRVMVRIMLANIRAESDFRPRVIGGERLDSGASWGLLQLSPGGGAQWMPFYKNHFNAATHNFTWGIDAPNVRANVRGALIDWNTGVKMNMANLVNEDLFRPWVNIHAAMFIQSNFARTASSDAWMWERLNDYSWALKQAKTTTLSATQSATYTSYLAGANLSRTPKTALGSWVAGAATNGWGSYTSAGDDVSANYFAAIMRSISFLYNGVNGAQWQPEWLERWTVNAGLTDYI